MIENMDNVQAPLPRSDQNYFDKTSTGRAGLKKIVFISLVIAIVFLLVASLGSSLFFRKSSYSTSTSVAFPLEIIIILITQLLPILVAVVIIASIGLFLRRIIQKKSPSIQQGIIIQNPPTAFGSTFLYVYPIFLAVLIIFSLPVLVFGGFFLLIYMLPLLIPILVVFLVRKLKSTQEKSKKVLWAIFFSGLGILLYATPFMLLSIFMHKAGSGY